MRVVVTGGSGLIGTELVQRLKKIAEVVVFDLQKPQLAEVNWVQGDVREFGDYLSEIGKFEGIVHLAAVSRVIDAENDPYRTWEVNVGGTLKVLESIRSFKPWIIYGSSREIYGEPSSLPVPETYPLVPINVYGVTKLVSEKLVREFVISNSSRGAILRFSNVYGGLRDHATRVIPIFVKQALQNETLRLNGKDNTFDFTHVFDTVDGILKSIKWIKAQKPGLIEDFNICTGKATTLLELATQIIELTESKSSMVENVRRSYDVNYFYGDYSKAKKFLGYIPEYSVEAGLSLYLKTIQKNLQAIMDT